MKTKLLYILILLLILSACVPVNAVDMELFNKEWVVTYDDRSTVRGSDSDLMPDTTGATVQYFLYFDGCRIEVSVFDWVSYKVGQMYKVRTGCKLS